MVSDKIANGLWRTYQKILPDKANKIVEIGILQGGGLRLLKEKYPNAHIIGIDINPRPNGLEECFEFHQLSQTDEGIKEYCRDADIVIDDASHIPHLTRITFDNIFPVMKKGAEYYIEDWHPAVLPDMARVIDDIESTGIELERYIIIPEIGAIAKIVKQT